MATGRELGGSKKHNVSILQEPWKYRLIPCLGIKLFLLMMPSRVFQAFYCAAVSPRRMSVLVASVPSLLPLLYKHWVAIWACDYNLSSSCFLLPKGKASHAVRFWRGAASSTEPLQWPPCPVLFTSNVFRAKISACVWGKTFSSVRLWTHLKLLEVLVVRWSLCAYMAAAVSRMLVSCVGWSILTCWRKLLKSCLWDVEETWISWKEELRNSPSFQGLQN